MNVPINFSPKVIFLKPYLIIVNVKDKLNAKLDEINAKINDLKILAPFDGITSVKNYSEGSLVKPGDVITTLYDIQNLKIQAKVPEKFINKINDKTIFS